jgi:hypothetical protein
LLAHHNHEKIVSTIDAVVEIAVAIMAAVVVTKNDHTTIANLFL